MMRPPGASLLLASSSSSSSPIIHATTSTTTTHATARLTRRTLLSLPLAGVVFTAHQAQAQPPSTTTTPYAQSRTLQLGLDANGKIRTCPSTNPGCVCTNPTVGASSSVASPLLIPDTVASAGVAAQLLRQAILKTQKNVIFSDDQQTTPPDGASVYIQAEVDGGGFRGRDVMEFLVKKDAGVVAYRCVATEVTFVYPFTTAVGDSRGQEQRIAAIAQDLGWLKLCSETLNAAQVRKHAQDYLMLIRRRTKIRRRRRRNMMRHLMHPSMAGWIDLAGWIDRSGQMDRSGMGTGMCARARWERK